MEVAAAGDCGQYASLVGSGHLLASENVARRAIHRIDRDDVRRAQWSDRSRKVCLDSQALANLLRQFGSDSLILGLAQILQVVVQFGVADQLNQWRLFKLDRKRLLQSGIEDRIAGLVSEIGENELVFVGELGSRRCAPEKKASGRQSCDHQEYGDDNLPTRPQRFRCDGHSARGMRSGGRQRLTGRSQRRSNRCARTVAFRRGARLRRGLVARPRSHFLRTRSGLGRRFLRPAARLSAA